MRVRDKQIAISPPLHHEVSILAAVQGTSIKDVTEKALRQYLDGNGKRLVDTRQPYHKEEA